MPKKGLNRVAKCHLCKDGINTELAPAFEAHNSCLTELLQKERRDNFNEAIDRVVKFGNEHYWGEEWLRLISLFKKSGRE